MRLFVSVELDDEARRKIGDEQVRLRAALGRDRSMTWVKPDRMHLTLAFLGEVAEPLAAAITSASARPVAHAPFLIELGGVGVFPPRGMPRVLWLGLSRGGRDLVDLQRIVADRLEGLGVRLEERPFHPHLTLARWRTSRSSDRARVDRIEARTPVARLEVGAVALVHSRLSAAGPAYATVAEARLRDPLESQ